MDKETEDKNVRVYLLAQLKEGSEYLENQKEALSRLWEGFRGKVVTFYETGPTNSVKKVCRHHTDRIVLTCIFLPLTLIAGARIARAGRRRSPNSATIVRPAVFTWGISLSGPL